MRAVTRQFLRTLSLLALLPAAAAAQQAAVVSGRVTTQGTGGLSLATVLIEGMDVGATTRNDGSYSFTVPAIRVSGQTVTITARHIGYRALSTQITLRGGAITQDFLLVPSPLRLEDLVVTGVGTLTAREKLGNVINSVDSGAIVRSQETNIVSALAAKAPNVEVKVQSGEPGASASIRIRGAKSTQGTGQPLFVVDGVPIDNTTNTTAAITLQVPPTQGTVAPNRALDLNPADIESVDILKGAAAAAIYGARAAEGVILITTKSGRAGPTRYSLRSSLSWDKVATEVPLQRSFGHGTNGLIAGSADQCIIADLRDCVGTGTSWGPRLTETDYKAALATAFPTFTTAQINEAFTTLYPNGITTFNHFDELFRTGSTIDNTLSASGGNERTTFYLSLGRNDQSGIFVGPNNYYDRTTARLKATHRLLGNLNVGGNVSYTDARGSFIQKGSNLSGVFLGGLRTPPNFDSRQYLDPVTGLHRAYRYPRPSQAATTNGRVYDNPFWTLNEHENREELNRIIASTSIDWSPLSWLTVSHMFGVDYYTDWRIEALPQQSSGGLTAGAGEVIRADLINYALDNSITASATWTASEDLSGTFTVGQNLNSEKFRLATVWGTQYIAPEPNALQNTVNWIPNETRQLVHREGYFAQGTVDFLQQLYFTAALRNDGFSTFGASARRHWFPKLSGAWTFTEKFDLAPSVLSFGKLRAAWGQTGREPIVYQTITAFQTGSNTSTWGEFLNYTQQGSGGLTTGFRRGNQGLKPERTSEVELGFDLGLFDQRADLGFTYYDGKSTDVIVSLPVPYSTGYRSVLSNAATITNKGIEIALNVRPVTTDNFSWDAGVQWAKNDNLVVDLAGAEFVGRTLGTFTGNIASMTPGYASGVFRAQDFARCGRGLTVAGVGFIDTLTNHCKGVTTEAVYLAADGRPRVDATDRVVADPNPDWAGSLRTSMTIMKRWQVSGLLDIREGGMVWNGTKGALYNFGTHKDTERRGDSVLVAEYLPSVKSSMRGDTFAGPGLTTKTQLNQSWFTGIGGSFNGPDAQDFEDGSFIKLREISISYTADQTWVRERFGFTSIDIRFSGRNLKTWTDYTGVDPETNLSGAEVFATGVDYFNNPASRSFTLSFGLNR